MERKVTIVLKLSILKYLNSMRNSTVACPRKVFVAARKLFQELQVVVRLSPSDFYYLLIFAVDAVDLSKIKRLLLLGQYIVNVSSVRIINI